MLKALALDPGGTTGYAKCEMISQTIRVRYGQAEWSELDLWRELEAYRPLDVVYESFQYRPGKAKPSVNLRPPELIGVVKLYGQRYNGSVKLHPQTAAKGKAYFSNKRIKELDLYKSGVDHGRDALRHLLHWLYFDSGMQYIDGEKYTFELV
jgi:hypothetical protein